MATVVDNKVLADAVRNYPLLYDKNSKNFKNRWEKLSAWEEVAKETGLVNGKIVKIYFNVDRGRIFFPFACDWTKLAPIA